MIRDLIRQVVEKIAKALNDEECNDYVEIRSNSKLVIHDEFTLEIVVRCPIENIEEYRQSKKRKVKFKKQMAEWHLNQRET